MAKAPNYYKVHTDGHEVAFEPIYEELVSVVHGEWKQVICHEEFKDGFVDRVKECCSVCHAPNGRRTSNYCPNCGAKMDGEREDNE